VVVAAAAAFVVFVAREVLGAELICFDIVVRGTFLQQ
jgi:hypothetical protein